LSYAVVDIELNDPLPELELAPGQRGLALLVRRGGRPIGWVLHELGRAGRFSASEVSGLIAERLRFELVHRALCDELIPPSQPVSGSLAVCVLSDGRPQAVEETVASVQQLEPAEVLVADPSEHAGSLGATRRRLLEIATQDFVAFFEAGTLVDRHWRVGLDEAISRPGVGMVSGPLLARELDTGTQVAFERRGGEHRGFHTRRWFGDPLAGAPLDPADLRIPWGLNNAVVDRRLLLSLGGLDSPAAVAYRVLRSGASVVYHPGLLASHHAPRERAVLRRRHLDWGRSLATVAGTVWSGAPERRMDMLSLAVRWAAFEVSEMVRAARGAWDADLIAAELWGALAGLPSALRKAPSRIATGEGQAREDPFEPLRIVHVDLSTDQPPEWPSLQTAFVVAWWREVPLGHLVLRAADAEEPTLRGSRLADAITPAVGERLFGSGFERVAPNRFRPAPAPPPALEEMVAVDAPLRHLKEVARSGLDAERRSVSVVVCTQRRPEDLRRCLRSLGELATEPLEVIVVDNDPDTPSAAAVVQDFPGVIYIHEPRPGLSIARNTGIGAARGAIVAFVDDDVLVHPAWLEALLRGFSDAKVLAVTGLVLPAELETTAQVIFETTMGQSGRGHRRIVFDQSFFVPQLSTGPPVWTIGAGANMAFRREAFERVGLFDERLGAGAAGCSEDSELWYRLLAAGGECHYLPEAVVFHRHRVDRDQLRRQAHDYMRGHVAALFLQYREFRHPGNLWRALITVPAHLLRRIFREVTVVPPARTGTITAELSGYLAGLAHFRFALTPPGGSRDAAGAQSPRWRIPGSPVAEPGLPDAPAPRVGSAAPPAPQ
jgi:GT2 family glycosyltransferase